MYGRRVSKADPRVAAYGAVDELNAAIGLARALSQNQFVSDELLRVQKELIVTMGELATLSEDQQRYLDDGFQLTNAKMVERVGDTITDLETEKALYPKDWVIPGANAASAALDLARTTCRRTERSVSELKQLNPEILRYLNRLSDLFWILARYTEKASGKAD